MIKFFGEFGEKGNGNVMEAATKKPPPPAPRAPPNSKPQAAVGSSPSRTNTVRRGKGASGEKVVIYGPGGVGKTTACALLAELGVEPLFIDIGDSTSHMDVSKVDPAPTTFSDVRHILHDQELLSGFGAVVIDDFTTLEELARAWTLENVPHEKGHKVTSIEGYGFGKGYVHTFETFLTVLADLDAIARSGKHVIATAHEQTVNVPNPNGEDWLQYQPRLMSTRQAQLRERVKEWCYHLLYVNFDKSVDKDGKAIGGSTRTIYPNPMATHWAKSRVLSEPIPYELGSADLWKSLLRKE